MINIFISKEHSKLILEYAIDDYFGGDWIDRELNNKGYVCISKLFYFNKSDLLEQSDSKSEMYEPVYYFELGKVIKDYIVIKGQYLSLSKDIIFYNYPDHFNIKWFKIQGLTRGNGSVFGFLEKHISKDTEYISIGNDEKCYLSWGEFDSLIAKFPTNHEIDLYVRARVTEVLKQHTYVATDYEERLNKYRDKRMLTRIPKEVEEAISLDIEKYELLLEKLKNMLEPQNIESYSESAWQKQIAKIILLIFPQYLAFFEKVRIKDSFGNKKYRELDFLLVNNNGNVDSLEIKKPTNNSSILRIGTYRENYVPSAELSGTIMQAEKYIANLMKWGAEGEAKLNEKYKSMLPSNINIQINSPKAVLILGQERNLDKFQINDIEIIKRKYSNITDIITYDDLIRRLENTLYALKQKSNHCI